MSTNGRTQMTAVNDKRPAPPPPRTQPESSPQHFDLIKYIYASWNSVSRELDTCHEQPKGDSSDYRTGATVTYYREHEPNPKLKDFEPFDLEAWWGQRFVQRFTRNRSS
ncbi:MAPK regulated corepressor interacting protein 2 [Orussus abietinus]|uniref:MAPK regulated corepressor interacting protein 2 n=1 Tax=Orussus abietinus TaxID=222816 RepID=UPI0006258242|nr:MAPK regulated corepressor interacting protein 2 [Orussus abietinus]